MLCGTPLPFVYDSEKVNVNEWQERAACRGLPPNLFFVDPHDSIAVEIAKDICRHCPVILSCLTYACDTDQQEGIWGGQTELERSCADLEPIPPLCIACGGDLIPVGSNKMQCIDCGTRWPML